MLSPNLPLPVSSFIEACNRFDLEAVMSTFSADALVNDHRCEFIGETAIRNWVAREIVGDRVTMKVMEVGLHGGNIAVTANIDGTFDKTGLPDPLVLTYYFSVTGERIAQLIIILNK